MPPFWGVLLWRQRQRQRRRDSEAPPGFGLSSEAAAAAAEAQAAAEAAAGSGAAAGEWGGRGITGRGWEGGKEGRREAPRGGSGPGGRRAQGPPGAAAPRSPRPGGRFTISSRVSGFAAPWDPPRLPGACPCGQGDPPSSWSRSLLPAPFAFTLWAQKASSPTQG